MAELLVLKENKVLRNLVLLSALAAGCAWGEDVGLYYIPLRQELHLPRCAPGNPNSLDDLDGVGVAVLVAEGADEIRITVSYSVAGKIATSTRTVGQPDNKSFSFTSQPGMWFPLWPHR